MTDDIRPEAATDAAAADPAAALAAAVAEITELNGQLTQARKEAAEATLRAQAELQNVRKRLERDADNARKYALEKFAAGLLPVIDTLERGLAAVAGEDEPARVAREGMALTLKLFRDTLAKFEVTEIDPRGEAFNPQFHEAIAHVPNGDVAANTVVDVMQKGFQLSGRLLRPAMVVVSRSP